MSSSLEPGQGAGAVGSGRDAVRVTFTLSEEDLRRGIKELPQMRRLFGIWGGSLVLLLIAMGLTGGLEGPDLSTTLLTWLVPCGILGLLFWYFVGAGAKRQHRLMKEAERTISYEFTPTGFSNESTGASARIDYGRVHRVVDAKHSLLIYCNQYAAQVVPKRAFGPGELETVQRWLAAAVKPRRASTFMVRTLVLWVVLIVVFLAVWQFLSPN